MQVSSWPPCVESWALCPAEPLSAPCLLTLPLSGGVCKRTGCNLHALNSTSFIPNKQLPLSSLYGLYLRQRGSTNHPYSTGIEFCFIPNYNIKLNRFVVCTMFTHIVPLSRRYQHDGEVHIAKSASALNSMPFLTNNSMSRQPKLAPHLITVWYYPLRSM